MKTYLVIGATGHTGRPIALGLLDAGHNVRIISRNAEKAKDLIAKGAELFEGESKDIALLTRAMQGADAAYLMIPFDAAAKDYTASQIEHVHATVEAIKNSGLKFLVTLSSVGAHLSEGNGVVKGLHVMEKEIDQINGLNVVHLRATYFLENTLGNISTLKNMNMMGTSVRADLPIPMVSTNDIAGMALKKLLGLDFTGSNVQYVLGARDYTYQEITTIMGKSVGKPEAPYVQFPYDQARQAMMNMGLGESVAGKLNEFVKALNEGHILEGVQRDSNNTTGTTAEEFSNVFRAVYES